MYSTMLDGIFLLQTGDSVVSHRSKTLPMIETFFQQDLDRLITPPFPGPRS